jgi:aldehyde:ferredoxin oxidoreductase
LGKSSGLELACSIISPVTDWDFTREELLRLGERMLNCERVFAVGHGLTPEGYYRVSNRFAEGKKDGPFSGRPFAPYLKGMVNEYSRLMGWDEKTGKPWRNTLKHMNLEKLIEDIWAYIFLGVSTVLRLRLRPKKDR